MSSPPALLALAALAGPHLVAVRTAQPPRLDGRLDDAVWRAAPASDAFTQKKPVDGASPGDPTIVRVLYDDEAIYVAIDCVQRAPLVASLTRRDRNVEADRVSVALDTRGDGKTAFELSVNAAGVLADTLRFNDTETSTEWDENWEAKATRTAQGWAAELRIPLRALRFDARAEQSWGLQVRRYVSARQEVDEWAHIPRAVAGEVSHYGRLEGLRGLHAPTSVELRPFVAASLRRHDAEAAPLARGVEPGFAAGLDLRWHLGPRLTLDVALLPDFGQIEADQVALNLTSFETYYPEKRPFFLEGRDLFTTPLQLVYTRRIGRAPPAPALREGESLVRAPVPSVIYGAAKLVGDLGEGLSVGELVALTGRQEVDVAQAGGGTQGRAADPLASYKVLRIKRALGSIAHAGLTLTAVNRLDRGADYPLLPATSPHERRISLCPGGEQVPAGARCFHDAYVGALDLHLRSASGEYTADAQALVSLIQGGPPRTLRDGTTIRSGDAAPALHVHAAKEGGRHWLGHLTYQRFDRKLDFNDLGYLERQNLHRIHAELAYRTLEPWGASRDTYTKVTYHDRYDLDGLSQSRSFVLDTFVRWKSFWTLNADLHLRTKRHDDREIGDGAALERAGLGGFYAAFSSDARGRVSGELWTNVNLIEGGFDCTGGGRLSIRPLPHWDAELLPSWIVAGGEPRYITTRGGSYLFGKQRAEGLGLTLRSTYTFTPELTLQAYAQVYVDALHYAGFTSAPARGAGTVVRLADLRPAAIDGTESPNHRGGTLNLSVMLRWEYRLGSTLQAVFTHAQTGSVTTALDDGLAPDLRFALPRPAEDAVLLKIAHWWGS
jgi:hypothetical protein